MSNSNNKCEVGSYQIGIEEESFIGGYDAEVRAT